MDRELEPVSAGRLAALAIIVAVAATVAVIGLILSDPGDDAERISYLAGLLTAGATGALLAGLAYLRRVEITHLRVRAAVLIFELRAHAAQLTDSARLRRESLTEVLRDTTRVALEARVLTETLIRAGVAQEAIELRVALEAIDFSLERGPATSAGGGP